MEAKGRIMSEKEANALLDLYGMKMLLQAQAEITWKAREPEIEGARKAGQEQAREEMNLQTTSLADMLLAQRKAGMEEERAHWVKEIESQVKGAYDGGRLAGREEERNGWLSKTDPEKARDNFTREIIGRVRAQAIKEVIEWIEKHHSTHPYQFYCITGGELEAFKKDGAKNESRIHNIKIGKFSPY